MMCRAIALLAAACLSSAAEAPKTVRDFGAAGNGEADDTAAIQKAVDSGSGEVLLLRGRYRITKPIVIDLDRAGPVSVRGDGTASLIMAGPGPAFLVTGTHAGTVAPASVKENV